MTCFLDGFYMINKHTFQDMYNVTCMRGLLAGTYKEHKYKSRLFKDPTFVTTKIAYGRYYISRQSNLMGLVGQL